MPTRIGTTRQQQIALFCKPVSTWPIVQTKDGVYHYVNHEKKLLTTGFSNQPGLERNADIIRVTPEALGLMAKHYANVSWKWETECPKCGEKQVGRQCCRVS